MNPPRAKIGAELNLCKCSRQESDPILHHARSVESSFREVYRPDLNKRIRNQNQKPLPHAGLHTLDVYRQVVRPSSLKAPRDVGARERNPSAARLQAPPAAAHGQGLPHGRAARDVHPPSLWVLSPLSTAGIVGHIALTMVCGKNLQDREVSIMCRPCPCPSSFARLEKKVTCL